ncbi:hypothetical protein AB0G02_11115 [Actinosynnema sp. NPDC023658]
MPPTARSADLGRPAVVVRVRPTDTVDVEMSIITDGVTWVDAAIC